ncbi:MAG: tryptophan synthase subunit alpha [Myxococcota bacterium]|nr:tryptophan synthase subunit alpha [Deltaproteobacteria bacterium]MDQ3339181.1 tryptophan synthase subunit alpha [Myxococcota bacterium]
MTRLRAAFDNAAREQRAALVAYLTFGDPDPATSIEVLAQVARAGADVIELGVPFSDPSADGPSIQRAMERALAAGGTLAGALEAVATLRARGIATPIVLFGYYNPVFVMGPAVFAERAARAGVDAVLTVDLPIDELAELATPLAAHGVGVIPLVAPTSTPERIARVAAFSPPFVYYISLTGVTGARAAAPVNPARIDLIRSAAQAPVAVGFGIRTPADAARFAAIADGVVVGTALVDRVAAGDAAGAPARVAALVQDLAGAMKR